MDIKKILSEMTLEEKASLCSGLDNWHTKAVKRLGLDSILMCDGPSGIRKENPEKPGTSFSAICYPTGSTLASTFNPDIAKELGDRLGKEAISLDIHTLLGPAINIKRTPLGGRNFEYLSEDPFLAGSIAAEYVKGVQENKVGVSVKHFACNNQEYMRMSTSANVSERALREIYFPAFEKTVKEAHPWTVMCSYNRINGCYSSKNKWLLSTVLRSEWGFDGIVMTDWGALCERVESLKSGTELEMPSSRGIRDKEIVKAVKDGTLSIEELDRAVMRLLVWISRSEGRKKEPFDYVKGHNLAIKIAQEGAILLKNDDNLLPLKEGEKITVLGSFAKEPRIQGGGSSRVNPHLVKSPLSILKERANVTYYPAWSDNGEECDDERKKEALEAIKTSAKVVIFAALPDSFESEGFDRHSLSLPECQKDLIREASKLNKNTIVVLFNGSAIEMDFKESVKAILEMNLPGEGVAEAVSSLLFGDINPSGRLSETYPLKLEDNPSYLNYPGDGRDCDYKEDVYVGYRYYDTKKMDVLFPFGYGLSYTTFALSELSVEENEDVVSAKVKIKNTGERKGKSVIELFIRPGKMRKNRPHHELKGFKKVELEPNEEKIVEFALTRRDFSYWEEKVDSWYVESGEYTIEVGFSSRDISLEKTITITSEPLPFILDEATTLSEVISHNKFDKLGEYGKKLIKNLDGSKDETVLKGEAALGMINSLPLYSIYSYEDFEEGTLEKIRERLKEN